MELQTFSLKTQNPDTLMLHNDMQTCCKQMKLWHFQGHSHFIAMLCLLLNNKEFSNLWGRIYSRIIVAKSNHWRKLWLCHVSQCEGITAFPLWWCPIWNRAALLHTKILVSNKRTSDVSGHNFQSSQVTGFSSGTSHSGKDLVWMERFRRGGQDGYLVLVALKESKHIGSVRGKPLSYLLVQNYSWHLKLVALSWFLSAGLPPDGIPGFIWDALNLAVAT